MALNQNPISSMYLKMRLARRYTSPAFLSETHPFLGASPDGVINDNETMKYRGLYWGKEGHLMMGCAGLEFTRSWQEK